MKSMAVALLGLATPSVGLSAQATSPPVIEELVLKSAVFGNSRTIRVLLPPGYQETERRYAVIYFTDGLAAFDERGWGVTSIVSELWASGDIPELIVVGIDNGGSTRESTNPVIDRASEYLPYADQSWDTNPTPEPLGTRFPDFLFNEVAPLVEAHFRVDTNMPFFLAGASYGGAATLYTALAHPNRLAGILVESPSLHIGDGRLLDDALSAQHWPERTYLGVGTEEGETTEIQDQMVQDVETLAESISSRGKTDLRLLKVEGATHWYDAWKARLPEALRHVLQIGTTRESPEHRNSNR